MQSTSKLICNDEDIKEEPENYSNYLAKALAACKSFNEELGDEYFDQKPTQVN